MWQIHSTLELSLFFNLRTGVATLIWIVLNQILCQVRHWIFWSFFYTRRHALQQEWNNCLIQIRPDGEILQSWFLVLILRHGSNLRRYICISWFRSYVRIDCSVIHCTKICVDFISIWQVTRGDVGLTKAIELFQSSDGERRDHR